MKDVNTALVCMYSTFFYPYITEALSASRPSALVYAALVDTIPVCAE